MKRSFARNLQKRFRVSIARYTDAASIQGYDARETQSVDSTITIKAMIDGHYFPDLTLVVLPEMGHDIILGKEWVARHDILLDCRRSKMIWPDERKDYFADRKLRIPRGLFDSPPSGIEVQHQEDMERRDRRFEDSLAETQGRVMPEISGIPVKTIKKKAKPARVSAEPGSGRKNPLQQMRSALRVERHLQPTYIAAIGAAAFNVNARDKRNEVFTTSIHEISTILREREVDLQPGPEPIVKTEEQMLLRTVPEEYHDLLTAFSKAKSDELPPHRKYDHKIEIDKDKGVPIGYHPLYNQTDEELKALKGYLEDNLRKGFIENSSADFASPVLFVKKHDGTLRFCIDYRKLNEITRKDRYPIPLIEETLQRLSRAKIFTKLDIRQAFNRIRMDPASEEYTTFRTRYGMYKSKVLPFGLCNGPATYQRYMNDVLFEYLDVICAAYMDDIIVYSDNVKEHALHVRKILERLIEAGLQVDIKKCEFGVKKTKFLGYFISTDGISVDPEKIAVIRDWGYPLTVRGVQAFIGFCNFYRRFIKEYGRVARPLNLLTRKGVPFDFNQRCKDAFQALKDALINAPVLAHYLPEKPTMLEADASDGVVAGVLSQQQRDDLWRPVAYYSKTMAPAECNYPIHDKELLAIIRAFEEWRAEIQGLKEPLKVYSDHKALEYFMTTKNLSARQARWAELLSRYHFTISYRPGAKNQKADALTRRDEDVRIQNAVKREARQQIMIPTDKVAPEIRLQITAIDSLTLLDRILSSNRTDQSLEPFRERAREPDESIYSLTDDGLLLCDRKLFVSGDQYEGVPLTTALIREVHAQKSVAHPGIAKTKKLLRKLYYWKDLSKNVETYVSNCHACRRSHQPRDKTPGLLHSLPIADRPWKWITMDFKDFPLSAKGNDAILVFMCRLSKRSISIPCKKSTTARQLAELFITHVYRYYGPPDDIVSDRGPQFVSAFWDEFTAILGVKLSLSTANAPQTDGQTEIMNQYIDQRLRPFVNHYQDNWDELLPIIDFAQASLPHESTGQSPIQTEMAYEPRTSYNWRQIRDSIPATERLNRKEAVKRAKRIHEAWEYAKGMISKAQERHATAANSRRREVDWKVGDLVWVTTKFWTTDRPSRKLSAQWEGPFPVERKKGHSYKLTLPPGINVHPVFHANKLRKDKNDPLPGQIIEPPEPIQVNDTDEWEVERILAVRKFRKQLRYSVKWVGYDNTDREQYPPRNFMNAPLALKEFHDKYPNRPGPPPNLGYWLECAEKDIQPMERLDDNLAP